GGRINTDAIDNSAGVDTSDHEVNIKILLGLVIADGEMTEKQRNALLAQMTDEVAALVLRDNTFQTQALSLAGRVGARLLEQQQRFIKFLERKGRLNRAIEYLPTDEEFADRKSRNASLTSPERAVLLAYSKMWLFDELLASDLPDDPWVGTALERYFPTPLRSRFGTALPRHPLKREIVATHVLNSMVNRVGATFVHRLMESTGRDPAQIVRAYLLARESFGLVTMWQEIEALDNKVPDVVQAAMVIELGRLVLRATMWFLRSRRLAEPMALTIGRFAPAVAVLAQREVARRSADARDGAQDRRWIDAGVPAALAHRVACAQPMVAALDIMETAESVGQPIERVADVHVAIGEQLGLNRVRQLIAALPSDGYWEGRAKAALADDMASLQQALSTEALRLAGDGSDALARWSAHNGGAVERVQRLLGELAEVRSPDLAMLSVALRELRNLA
nr:NAD-glutamate dehydrogenase [Burkholderiaceae bacterium]